MDKQPVKVEYRVRSVDRYHVTAYHEYADGNAMSRPVGEYANPETAYEVAYALARKEHEDLGWEIGDKRMQYPEPWLKEGMTAMVTMPAPEQAAA